MTKTEYLELQKSNLLLIDASIEGVYTNNTKLLRIYYSFNIKNWPVFSKFLLTSEIADLKVKLTTNKTMTTAEFTSYIKELFGVEIELKKVADFTNNKNDVLSCHSMKKISIEFPKFQAGMEKRSKGSEEKQIEKLLKWFNELHIKLQAQILEKFEVGNPSELSIDQLNDSKKSLEEAMAEVSIF